MSLIIDRVTIGPLQVNTYLIMDGETGSAWLVDVGGDDECIAEMVRRHGAKVCAVAATHGHIDHVAGAARACETYRVPFYIHEKDAPLVSAIDIQAGVFGFPKTKAPAQVSYWSDGQKISIGASSGVVIPTPGHTPGGVCLFFKSDELLLTGDTLFSGSVGRTDLPGGDSRALLESIKNNVYSLQGNLFFYPGHGPRGRLDHERKFNPFVRSEGLGDK